MSRTTESQPRRRRRQARGALKQLNNLDIHKAIPEGHQRAASQALWLHRLTDIPEFAQLRSDAEANARKVAWALGCSADWRTKVARPGWQTLIDRTGLSRSTVAKYLALFVQWGIIARVRTGSTWRTRGCNIDDRNGNLAGEYVLCVTTAQEPVEETRTPSLSRQGERSTPHVRARETAPQPAPRHWSIHATTRTRGDQRQAAQRLRQLEPTLHPLTDKHLTRLLRPCLESGWNLAQVRYALNHTPDGQQRWHTDTVRHPEGWLNHRLGQWAEHVPPRQLGAGQSTDLTAADVAALPRPAAPTADVAEHASLARRLLAATKRRSDKSARPGLGVCLPGRDGELAGPAVEPDCEPVAAADDDWLLRNAARQAEPDLLSAFSGLQLGVA